MSGHIRLALFVVVLAMLSVITPVTADGQKRGDGHRPPAARQRTVAVRGQVVFIGGYLYDPYFGPYPWWPRTAYPYWYYPVYDTRAYVRVLASPRDAAVYVDGFYAGIVDDFDGMFQELPLPPGGHELLLYLDGYRTVSRRLYLRPGSTLKLHETMERLPAGVVSEPPPVAPPVPPPPAGSVTPLRTPPRRQPPPSPSQVPGLVSQVGFGSLMLRVQPANAEVMIDGDRWVSSDAGQFVIQVSVGTHHVDVITPGYRRFSTEIQVREGEATPLNVSLSQEP
jgi:hypothetical protein